MQSVFTSAEAVDLLAEEIPGQLALYIERHPISVTSLDMRRAADYLVAELGREHTEFIGSKYAVGLVDKLRTSLDDV
ncbi:MAG: hypothetical protein ACI915_003040 [Gammaproteobacteria bacterium]|jgi:hypothetical protein